MSAPTTDAVPRRPRADAQRNAERLLDAASEVFAEQGPGASLEEIARRAGVGIGTLYRHFPTRQELQVAVFTNAVASAQARADELLAAEDPRDAFATWLRDQLDQAGFCRALGAEVMISSLHDEPDAPSPCEAMRTAGAALLARAQQSGSVRADATIDDLLRLVSAIALATDDAPERAAQTERMFSLVMDGIRS